MVLHIAKGLALATLLVTLSVSMARGQGTGTAQVKTAKVTQGSNVSMDVMVDKAATIRAEIYVYAFPDGVTNTSIQLHGGLPAGQTKCTVSASIPIDAKPGKWLIKQIIFAPASGGEQKELSKHGDLSFEVVTGEKIIFPDSATISDIK